MERFLFGCCYYPEHWDFNAIEGDIRRIRDLGMNVIRMGKFAWSLYEPQEEVYDFSWLKRAVACAEKYAIQVLLRTPTAAPPRYEFRSREIRQVAEELERVGHI